MAQHEDHILSRCPKCGAEQGEYCVTRGGRVAEKVHYGRPYWSMKTWEYKRRHKAAEGPSS